MIYTVVNRILDYYLRSLVVKLNQLVPSLRYLAVICASIIEDSPTPPARQYCMTVRTYYYSRKSDVLCSDHSFTLFFF